MSSKQKIAESAAAIRQRAPDAAPEVGIVFGTGLSSLAQDVKNAITIPYGEIPHFARSTVESHAGELVLGELAGRRIIAMKGRFHFYEGYGMQEITHPVRVMRALGARTLIVSNACGGMNPRMAPGEICILEDHINLQTGNPLIGHNDADLGPRFPDMSRPYDPELAAIAEAAALRRGIKTHRAVYVAVNGPNLETRAEYRFLRAIGADLVGMSTVPEVIVAVHQGMKVVGFSIITDSCLPDALKATTVDEIIATAGRAEPHLNAIVKDLLAELPRA
jgi:purine-nucleoside phosphorylase